MNAGGYDSRGRLNPAAHKAWARGAPRSPEDWREREAARRALEAGDGRATHGGLGARARRRLRREAEAAEEARRLAPGGGLLGQAVRRMIAERIVEMDEE